MSNYCINLNEPGLMKCVQVPILKPLYKCWLIDNALMFFSPSGISKSCLEEVLGYRSTFTSYKLIQHLKKHGLEETSCLTLSLIDSKIEPGSIFSYLYEDYKRSISQTTELESRTLDTKVRVRQRYHYGYMGCGCTSTKITLPIPLPPYPPLQSSQCICIEYQNKITHFTANIPLSNIQVENILRNNKVSNISMLINYLYPILIEPSSIGVLNGIIDK